MRRTAEYASFLRISGALYLGIFEQPGKSYLMNILMKLGREKEDLYERVKKLNIAKSLDLFGEATKLFPEESWVPENPAILSKENTPSFLNPAKAAD